MEIVVVLGINAAGKTTYVQELVEKKYCRVNRDERGGTLDGLPAIVEAEFKKGKTNFVLDNTYADVESRKSIIACAKKLKLPIRCLWLDTSFEDAQYNACQRMIQRTGKLLMPEDFKATKDPNLFPPVALFSYKKRFQKPTTDEGFVRVDKVAFVRRKNPLHVNKALILDYDDNLRTSKGSEPYPTKPSEVEILPGRKEKLAEYVKKGYLLLGASNQSGIAKKKLSYEDAVACFEKTNELLGHDIKYSFCPHSVPPIVCYCRKPHPGLGVAFIEKYNLDASQCIFVGDQTTDKTWAARCGFQFQMTKEFFG